MSALARSAGAMVDGFARRRFEDLHPKDQQIKQSKKLCIEQNWRCKIQHCLPDDIRPRIEIKKGAKARIGDDPVEEEAWWNWSVEILKALEELSSMTMGDLDYSRELLTIEVEHRQQNPKSTQRKILELLLGDVQRVVDDQRKKLAADNAMDTYNELYGPGGAPMDYDHSVAPMRNRYSAIEQGNTFIDPPQDDYDMAGGPHNALVGDYGITGGNGYDDYAANGGADMEEPMPHMSSPTLRPSSSAKSSTKAANPTYNMPRAAPNQVPQTRQSVVENLKTTEMKARAARLRAEAVRFEAECVALEVKARELREQLGGMDSEE